MSDNPDMGPGAESVGAKVAGGAALNAVAMLSIRLIGLFSIAVLGRLLTPVDFGIMAIAMVVVGLVEAISNRQFEMFLIRTKDPERAHYDTAFTMAFLLGVLMTLVVLVAAAPFAVFFDTPELEGVLLILSVLPVLVGLRNPNFVRFEIALQFRPRVIRNITSRLAMVLVSVLSAVAFEDYRALVAGALAQYGLFTLLTWVGVPERPTFTLRHWRAILAFGGWITGAGITDFLVRRLPAAVLGQRDGLFLAGVLQVGSELANTMTRQMLTPLGNALYPGLAKISQDVDRLRQGYLLAQQGILVIALPVGVGLAMVAPELIRVAVGTQWVDSVVVVQILAPIGALSSLSVGVRIAMMISGDTRSLFIRNLLILMLLVPMLLVGHENFGFIGVIWALVAGQLFGLFLTLRLAAKATDSNVFAPLYLSWRSVISTASMALVVWQLRLQSTTSPFGVSVSEAAMSLGVFVAAGAVVYVAVHLGLWRVMGKPDGVENRYLDLLGRLIGKLRSARAGAS